MFDFNKKLSLKTGIDNSSSASNYRTPEEEARADMSQNPAYQPPPQQGPFGGQLGGMLMGGALAGGGSASPVATGGMEAIGTALDGSTMMGSTALPGAATTTAAPTLAGSTTLGSFLPAAGIAAGAYTGMQQLGGIKNALDNKEMDFKQEAALALPTFGASFLVDPVRGMFDGNKDKDQRKRDAIRANAQQQGILDDNYKLDLGGGRIYDLGKDGSTKPYNIDFSKEGADVGVQYLKPFAALLAGGDKKGTDDFTGILYNELTANGTITDPAEIRQQALRLAANFGLTPSTFLQSLEQHRGVFGDDELNAFTSTINSLRPGGKPLVSQRPAQQATAQTSETPVSAATSEMQSFKPVKPGQQSLKMMGMGATY